MLPRFSLVVATLGRSTEIIGLFDSLAAQTFQDFEVILVDQNTDDRLEKNLLSRAWPFPVDHIKTPDARGVSRGRNTGWRKAQGNLVLFPDDDCWYAPNFLEYVSGFFDAGDTDILSGRAACPETLASINGRFEETAQPVDRRNVWTTQIEWVAIFRRAVLEAVGGYDEAIGVGAATPWQACEAQDIVLRAIEAGLKVRYDPSVYGFHAELDVQNPDRAMRLKGRGYARGHGYVLRLHGFGLQDGLYWIARPAANACLNLARLRMKRVTYLLGVALGRAEGYLGRTAPF